MANKRNFQRSSNCLNFLKFFHLISSLIYLSSVVIKTVKSDQIDCKDIQCPPDIKCPEDSILHNVVLYEPPSLPPHQIPPDYNDHDYNDDDEVEKSNANDKINKNKNNMDDNDNNNLNFNIKNENRHNQKQHISTNSKTIIEYNHDDGHLLTNNKKMNFLDKINKNNDNNNNNNNNNNDNGNTNSHTINKRSVEYKQRESIKIIPGDYISLIPMDGFNYNSNNKQIINLENQNQKKRKRRNSNNSDTMTKDIMDFNIKHPPLEVSPLIKTENLTVKCCPKQECICKDECKFPKCEKYGKITIQIEIGTNKPGKCCPKYKCIDDVLDCTNSSFNNNDFWIKDCMRCECISGHRFCHDSCNDADSLLTSKKECFSSKQQRPYKDGEFWIEDNCTECECLDGERKCQISSCKPKNCPKQIKIPNECCPICVDENDNSIAIAIPSTASSSSITSTETTTKIESFTTSSSSSSFSSELPQSTEDSSKSDTSSIVISSTILLEENSTKKHLITNSYLPGFETTTQTVTPIICNNSMMITSSKPLVEHSERILNMLGASKESLILCAIIVGLMILCAIFVALYLYEVTKRRTTYRSIPSSDSNLSQIPRPVKTSTPPLPNL